MNSPADHARHDDETLIRRIVQAQTEALAQLYDRYHRLVFGLALAIVGDRPTAEEITLDVFMRVWQKAATYRPEQARVSTWLSHIARHHAIDVLRRRAVRPDHGSLSLDDLPGGGAAAGSDPHEQVELRMRRERIRAALGRLPAEQRQALALAYFGGLSQREIAETLSEPLGTIKTRLRLALLKLRELLRDESGSGDQSAQALAAYSIPEEDDT
jgi:RNA polymerase sigma-70 factor (ECF subfamily)